MRQPASAVLVDADVLDDDVLDLVRELRGRGVRVGLVSAGGADAGFDVVIDPAGKPSREFFAAACAALGVPPDRCLLVDGEDRHVRGARVAGLAAYRYNGPGDFAYLRAAIRP